MYFSEVKSGFGIRVRLGNRDLDFENRTHANLLTRSTCIRVLLEWLLGLQDWFDGSTEITIYNQLNG